MTRRIIHVLALTVVFPCLVSVIVYYGFATNYTSGVFHEQGFRAQYGSGIYKYRVLGPWLLLVTHRFVSSSDAAAAGAMRRLFAHVPSGVGVLDSRADPTFYAACFLQNTLFMVVACLFLYLSLSPGGGRRPRSGPVVIGALLMGLTQYVVTPYDTLSYALLALSFFLIRRHASRFSWVVLVMLVSTLARETSVLAASFYFACHRDQLLRWHRGELARLAVLLGAFLTVYVGVRLWLGVETPAWHSLMFGYNATNVWALIGLSSMPVVSYLLLTDSPWRREAAGFLAGSAPYVLAMPVVAVGWETRLWVPVWLGLIALSNERPAAALADDGRPTTSTRLPVAGDRPADGERGQRRRT